MELNIEKFSPAKAELQGLVQKAKLVTKESSEEEIHEMRKILRSTRTSITGTGKTMREDAVKFQKDVIAKEKELVAIISPEEDRIAAIEDELEIKKQREARQAILPQRKARIEAIADNELMPGDEVLLDMESTDFEGYLNERVAAKNRKEQEEIDAEKRKLDEERAKLDREKELHEAEERGRREAQEKAERGRKEQEVASQKKVTESLHNPSKDTQASNATPPHINVSQEKREAMDGFLIGHAEEAIAWMEDQYSLYLASLEDEEESGKPSAFGFKEFLINQIVKF